MYSKIEECRICGNRELVQVLDLGVQTLTGVFPASRTQNVTAGPLRLVKCFGADTCGLLQLEHTYDLAEMYGLNYGYRSGLNASMVRHLQSKVQSILGLIKLEKNALVLDIGSNDSTTLQAYPNTEVTLVGIDPTGVKFKNYYPPHIQLIPDFFTAAKVKERFGSKRASVITSFSMFYDLEAPLAFMRDIADVLDENGVWVFEQSYMPTMLERNSYDTVCHEHLEYYTLKQIAWMAQRTGLKIIDVELNDVNGGSFSVVAAKEGSKLTATGRVSAMHANEQELGLDTLKPYQEFAERVSRCRQDLLAFIEDARKSGRTVCALGASTKGNVLLQYCGITESQIAKVGEVNAEKFGCFTPGTLLPIVPEDQLLAEKPDYLVILPWHFRAFFESNPKFAGRQLVWPLPSVETAAR
jgi:NDP-4-keto-2,6-dideoxyhexose 3-C-methyltransferase